MRTLKFFVLTTVSLLLGIGEIQAYDTPTSTTTKAVIPYRQDDVYTRTCRLVSAISRVKTCDASYTVPMDSPTKCQSASFASNPNAELPVGTVDDIYDFDHDSNFNETLTFLDCGGEISPSLQCDGGAGNYVMSGAVNKTETVDDDEYFSSIHIDLESSLFQDDVSQFKNYPENYNYYYEILSESEEVYNITYTGVCFKNTNVNVNPTQAPRPSRR